MLGKTEEKKVGKANRTRSNHVCKLFFQGATALFAVRRAVPRVFIRVINGFK